MFPNFKDVSLVNHELQYNNFKNQGFPSIFTYNVDGQRFVPQNNCTEKLWFLKCHISWITNAISLKDYCIPPYLHMHRWYNLEVSKSNSCVCGWQPIHANKTVVYELYGFTGSSLCNLKDWCQISCFYQKVNKSCIMPTV